MSRLAITDALLWDGTGSAPRPGSTLLIEDGRIAAIDSDAAVAGDALRIDAAGKWVMPGLIDMHVHVMLCGGQEALYAFLGCGITSVRDLGGEPSTLLAMRDALARGDQDGPRLFVHGPMLDGDPPIFGAASLGTLTWLCRDAQEGCAHIDKLLDMGVDGVKLYAGLRPDVLGAMARHVAGRVPVAAHLGRTWASEAIDGGIDTLEHVHASIYQDVARPEDRHTREGGNGAMPNYWTWLSEGWSRVDLEADYVKAFIEELVRRDVVLSPTTVLCTGGIATREAAQEPGQKYRPRAMAELMRRRREVMRQGVRDARNDGAARARRSVDPEMGKSARDNELRFIQLLHEAGGRLTPGTDVGAAPLQVPGFSMHRELALLVEGGLSNEVVLGAATREAARVLRKGDELGTLEVGKRADVLLIDGNPLGDIHDTRKLVHVIKDGKLYEPQALLDRIETE